MKIYKLIKDGEVIYVGRTILSLNRRKNSNFYKIPRDISIDCEIELIEETDDKSRERYWIDYYRKLGHHLYNKRRGDFKHNEEAYEDRKRSLKEKRAFKPKTKEEKLSQRRAWYNKHKDVINEERRKKYSNGKSWYHRNNPSLF